MRILIMRDGHIKGCALLVMLRLIIFGIAVDIEDGWPAVGFSDKE
jgi:hypothetical protein